MQSLKMLCDDGRMALPQRRYFFAEVGKILSQDGDVRDVVQKSLRYVSSCYSAGGHSRGRSSRSTLLEKTIEWLDQNQDEKAKIALSVLIAMYFDYEYINREGWFDYKLEGIQDIPLEERIHLCSAAFLLGLDCIPNTSEWSKQKIYELVEG